MASTYSTNLRLELIGTGDQQGTWGNTTNNNLGTLLEQAIGGYTSVTVSNSGDTTLTVANGTTDQSRNMTINLVGTISAARNVICPAIQKLYIVKNATTGGYAVTFKVSGQTGVTIPNGATSFVYVDGTDVREVTGTIASQSSSNVSITGGTITGITPLAIASGGTNASNVTTARTNLGLGTLATQNGTFSGTSSGTNTGDQNLFSTISVSGQSSIVADSTSDTLTFAAGTGISITTDATNDIITITNTGGGGGGGGTVTSVSGTGTVNGITLSGTVNTSGSLTLGGALSNVSLSTQVTGTLGVANGGTGATTLTGYIKGSGTGAFTASNTIPNTAITGLGNVSTYTVGTSGATVPLCNGTNTWSNKQTLGQSSTALEVGSGTGLNTPSRIRIDGVSSGGTTGTAAIESVTSSTATRYHYLMTNPNGTLGGLYSNGTSVGVYTPSDYRLKTNVEDLSGASIRLKSLVAKRFNWNADPSGEKIDGFIAHELQQVVPESVGGEKDAVDEFETPIYQTVDFSKIIPLLSAALRESIIKIESLEARISALESA